MQRSSFAIAQNQRSFNDHDLKLELFCTADRFTWAYAVACCTVMCIYTRACFSATLTANHMCSNMLYQLQSLQC
jgi:hypothetical protein